MPALASTAAPAAPPTIIAHRPKPKNPPKRFSSSASTASLPLPAVVLGRVKFATWFEHIYPEELIPRGTATVFVCGHCFRYTASARAHAAHVRRCGVRARGRPPGTVVYDDGRGYAVWEVDGEREKLFAQNLSLFAKAFLDHKSVFFDVASFLYYILTFTPPAKTAPSPSSASSPPADPDFHILGYFSKEKLAWDPNNLACILIFPPYQRRQLGKLLMGVSYKLSAWEFEGGMLGGPERPLSEMGRRAYLRFWQERLVRFFLGKGVGGRVCVRTATRSATAQRAVRRRRRVREGGMTVGEIGMAVGMLGEDVAMALKEMGVIEVVREKGARKQGGGAQGRKRKRKNEEAVVLEEEEDEGRAGIIRKSAVLAFAKKHHIALDDPVREEGFIGEIAPEDDSDDEMESASGSQSASSGDVEMEE